MEKITLSPAQPEDAQELSEISMLAKAYWQYPREWLARWKEELTITPEYTEQHHVCTIRGADQIVGFCALEKHPDFFEVAHLWVRPLFMGKGLGKKLLHHTLAAMAPGTEVRVVADPHAEIFYQKQGFVTYDQVESYPSGRFLPLMKKQW